MITKDQKKKIKAVLKNGYPKEVQKNLIKKGFLNRNGNPFRTSFILNIMNGKYSNYEIEEAIIELYMVKREEIRLIHERRNEILGL